MTYRRKSSFTAAGQAEHDTAQAKGWVEGATDSVVGNAKNLAGKALGDKELEAKGYAQATGKYHTIHSSHSCPACNMMSMP